MLNELQERRQQVSLTFFYKMHISPLLILTFTGAVSSPRDWNSLTDSLLSAAEGAEDSVAKFTSLVRARD